MPLCACPWAVAATSSGHLPGWGSGRGGTLAQQTAASANQVRRRREASGAGNSSGRRDRAVKWSPRWTTQWGWAPQSSRCAVEGSPPQTGHPRDIFQGLRHLTDIVSDLGTPEGPHPVRWKVRVLNHRSGVWGSDPLQFHSAV